MLESFVMSGDEKMDSSKSKDTEKTIYKLSEVLQHKSRESCWMVIHDKVYDVTEFLDEVSH